jgi:intein-encoded DNA endonuclease-like protein
MKESYLYKKLENKKAQCQTCSHYCILEPGQRGICGVRENIDGKISVRLSKSILKKLYVNKKLSMEKISKMLCLGITTVWKFIHKYNIPVRRFKYKKYDFSNDPAEKAYLLGLVAGDFCAYKHCRQIAVEVTATHPTMMELFRSVFKKYGTPTERIKYNKITGRYEKVGHVLLNNSFEFLLSKNFDINNQYFYHFLAGFFDSEGCVHVYNNHGYIGLSILLYNSNKKLLENIKNRLEKDGFHPKFYKFFGKGEKTTDNYIRRNDLWAVALHTTKEILSLMKRLPIKHQEKIEKIKIVISSDSNRWDPIAEKVTELKSKIKNEVKEFITS